jgi:NAD(P)H-hydrate epimerase
MTEDTAAMEKMLRDAGGELVDFDPNSGEQQRRAAQADLFVDALFGIGLNADIRGRAQTAISWMNQSKAPVVAADIASGIHADSGRMLGCATQAAVTVTFTLPKAGHYVGEGGLHTGRLVVHEIGIPQALVDGLETEVTVIDRELVASFLPQRPEDGNLWQGLYPSWQRRLYRGTDFGLQGRCSQRGGAGAPGGAGEHLSNCRHQK